MADKDLQMDVAQEAPHSSKLKLIIIILLLVIVAGGGAAFFLMSGEKAPAEPAVDHSFKAAVYMPIKPSFVVNFANSGGETHYLQLEVTLMGRDPALMLKLEENMPLIQSKLVEIFQTQNFETLKTPEGKEAMRTAALQELQALLKTELGEPVIEKMYFTSFVLQ